MTAVEAAAKALFEAEDHPALARHFAEQGRELAWERLAVLTRNDYLRRAQAVLRAHRQAEGDHAH